MTIGRVKIPDPMIGRMAGVKKKASHSQVIRINAVGRIFSEIFAGRADQHSGKKRILIGRK